jgi:hypothetical protein
MFEIMCVFIFLVLITILALVHYMKNCTDGEFSIKGEFCKLFKFEIYASGSKKRSKNRGNS